MRMYGCGTCALVGVAHVQGRVGYMCACILYAYKFLWDLIFANFVNQWVFGKMKTRKFVHMQYKFAAAGQPFVKSKSQNLLGVGCSRNIRPAKICAHTVARYDTHALVGVAHVHGWAWHMHMAWCGTFACTYTQTRPPYT